jgi:hypothetical protein
MEFPNDAGISHASVQRLWAANAITEPAPVQAGGKHFEAKSWDVIGLDRDPPESARVPALRQDFAVTAL